MGISNAVAARAEMLIRKPVAESHAFDDGIPAEEFLG